MIIKNKGDLAKLRRMIGHLDNFLLLMDDTNCFKDFHFKQVEAIVRGLEDARGAIANAMMQHGDDSGYRNVPKYDLLKRPQYK